MKTIIDKLNKRILEISIKHNLSHLGSCFTALPIIFEIYNKKKSKDKFVLYFKIHIIILNVGSICKNNDFNQKIIVRKITYCYLYLA